jgi:hypothetical protein
MLRKGSKPKAFHNAGHARVHRWPIPGRPEVEAIRRGISCAVNRQNAATEAIPGFEQLEFDPEIRQKSRRIEPRKPSPDDCNSRSHWILSTEPRFQPHSANSRSRLEHLYQKIQSEPRIETILFQPPSSPRTGKAALQSAGDHNFTSMTLRLHACTPHSAHIRSLP